MRHLFSYTIAFILISLIFISCAADDYQQHFGVKWTDKSKEYVRSGIDALYIESEFSLEFMPFVTDISTDSEEDWLIPELYDNDQQKLLKITVKANTTNFSREGFVRLFSGDQVIRIKVRQMRVPSTDKSTYYTAAEGGNITIKVITPGRLTADISAIEGYWPNTIKGDWAKIINITPGEKQDEHLITLSIVENEGLGRIAALYLKVNGEDSLEAGPYIIQEPAQFEETVAIQIGSLTDVTGYLPVLMGNDLTNLRRIRNLKISGNINGFDFQFLRKLYLNNTDDFNQYPIHLDISECDIKSGSKDPYEVYYGWKVDFPEYPKIFLANHIPDRAFSDAANLHSIKLPKSLNLIGNEVFMNCTSLKSITIPDNVEKIYTKAFYGCTELKDIKISNKSKLRALGSEAFNTGSKLNDIYLPKTLNEVDPYTFMFSTTGLHVRWLEPLKAIIIRSLVKESTLYVPKGTLELYKNDNNWGIYQNIVEEVVVD